MFDKKSFSLLSVYLITIIFALALATTVQGLDGNEGDNCFINGTQEGICTKITECEKPCAAEEVIFERCKKTARRTVPIVCCPKVRPITSISAAKCLEYKELACTPHYVSTTPLDDPIISKVSNCARNTQPVIIGGEEAQRREFPHMALIAWGDDDNFGCGGTLISDQFVLTAAHCLNNYEYGPISNVRLGEHDQSNTNESVHIDVKVAELIPHPYYRTRYHYNDIALIKLEHPVNFTDAIRPACLPEEPISFGNMNATATGWGSGQQKERSNVLMKVGVEVFDHNTCSEQHKPNLKSPQGVRETTQFCAGSATHINNTCGGDSGGPLQIMHKYHYCTFTIIGVTSAGKACENFRNESVGIYTRVYPYLSWIESVVWPEQNANE